MKFKDNFGVVHDDVPAQILFDLVVNRHRYKIDDDGYLRPLVTRDDWDELVQRVKKLEALRCAQP